jgi:RimJ/RimL family protein N-acetyltransferase
LLEGKNVNLRVAEKEDLSLASEWVNNLEFWGEYQFIPQQSRGQLEKMYNNMGSEEKMFLVEKKDGSKIGSIGHRPVGKAQEIGYGVLPSERGKGYCSEAAEIMVDYLFLSKDIVRIQAHTDTENLASQRVLEKAGFKKEGIVRKDSFVKGEWRDSYLYSILREEWKEPKILTKAT